MGLKRGQTVMAIVEETLPHHDYILSYEGHLIRVHNRTGQPWKKNDRVPMVVSGVNPLEFQVLKKTKTRISIQV